jgi:hypothetical protein
MNGGLPGTFQLLDMSSIPKFLTFLSLATSAIAVVVPHGPDAENQLDPVHPGVGYQFEPVYPLARRQNNSTAPSGTGASSAPIGTGGSTITNKGAADDGEDDSGDDSGDDTGDPVDFCDPNIGLSKQAWNDSNVGGFLQVESLALQPFSQGIQDSVKALAGGIANYECGPDLQCEITGTLSDACADSPNAVASLIGMANFNNFFRSIRDRTNEVQDDVASTLDQKIATFKSEQISEAEAKPDTDAASLGLTVAGILTALVPELALTASPILSIAGAAVPVAAGDDPDPDFAQQFVSAHQYPQHQIWVYHECWD